MEKMVRLFCFTLVLTITASCKPGYKKCEFQTSDYLLKAYNDILNEIITKHSYNIYLGKDDEKIFERYANNIADSENIDKEVIEIHNSLFDDTSRFCTIYLDTMLRPAFNSWSYFQKDTNSFGIKVKNLIRAFSENGQTAIDSLNSTQIRYSPQNFKLCIANIQSIKELKTEKEDCYIGKIVFSKLILDDTKTKGLLYYEFKSGELCGYGSLILIEKIQNDWTIKQALRTWTS